MSIQCAGSKTNYFYPLYHTKKTKKNIINVFGFRFIIYASDKLPITICKTEYADEVYNTLLGTIYMGVPCGSVKRLQQWPHLKSTKDFEMKGENHGKISSEIVLSSAGN